MITVEDRSKRVHGAHAKVEAYDDFEDDIDFGDDLSDGDMDLDLE